MIHQDKDIVPTFIPDKQIKQTEYDRSLLSLGYGYIKRYYNT